VTCVATSNVEPAQPQFWNASSPTLCFCQAPPPSRERMIVLANGLPSFSATSLASVGLTLSWQFPETGGGAETVFQLRPLSVVLASSRPLCVDAPQIYPTLGAEGANTTRGMPTVPMPGVAVQPSCS